MLYYSFNPPMVRLPINALLNATNTVKIGIAKIIQPEIIAGTFCLFISPSDARSILKIAYERVGWLG